MHGGMLGGSSGPSQPTVLAAAAAAEIIADAARRNPLTSDYIVSGPTETINGRTVFAPFSSASNLNLTLTGAVTPIVMMIAGKRYAISGALVVALTDASDNFVYYDGDTGALGTSVISPRWWNEAPSAPATDQHWFDMRTGLMKRYTGAAWETKNRIFLGLWRADTTINAKYGRDVIGLTVEERVEEGGMGTDGPISTNNSNTTVNVIKNYSSVVQRGTSKFVHTANLLSSAPIIRIQGYFLNLDTAGVALNGLGSVAGAGGTGAGSAGTGFAYGAGGGGGGGSAASAGGTGGTTLLANRLQVAAGTGGASGLGGTSVGGAGGTGAATNFPSSVGMASQGGINIGHGGGGGGGAGSGAAAGATGGAGGGSMDIHAISVTIDTGATFSCNGANGTDSPAAGRAASGAGGGGRSRLRTKSLADHNGSTFTATGGTGGVGVDPGVAAGHGGNGGAGVFEIKDL